MADVELSIIIPVFNESHNLDFFLTDLKQVLDAHSWTSEVILINDGSTDSTARIAQQHLQSGLTGQLIDRATNRGKGYSVRQGVKEAVGQKVIIVDGDGAFSATYLPVFFRELDFHPVVLGVKTGYPLRRRILSYAFNGMVQLLFTLPTSDALCGLKGFQREVARKLYAASQEHGWLFDVEVLTKIPHNYSVITVPVRVSKNPDSKFKLTDPLLLLWRLLVLRFSSKHYAH